MTELTDKVFICKRCKRPKTYKEMAKNRSRGKPYFNLCIECVKTQAFISTDKKAAQNYPARLHAMYPDRLLAERLKITERLMLIKKEIETRWELTKNTTLRDQSS